MKGASTAGSSSGKSPPSSSYAMAAPVLKGFCVRVRSGFHIILQVHPAGEIPITVLEQGLDFIHALLDRPRRMFSSLDGSSIKGNLDTEAPFPCTEHAAMGNGMPETTIRTPFPASQVRIS